jgi:lipopolysaccharide export system protein LptA
VILPAPFAASESGLPGGSPRSGLRTISARSGRLIFASDGESLDVGTFDQDVVLTDGTRATLKAAKGTVRGADQAAVFSGDSEHPASYVDERGSLNGATISYQRSGQIVGASGNVRSVYTSVGGGLLPGAAPDEPFHSLSDTLRYAGVEKTLTLTGNVKAWQKEQVLRCRTLLLDLHDEAAKSLRAEGTVQVFLRRKPVAPPGTHTQAPAQSETVNASGELLTYREADRFIRIETQSRIVSGSWVIASDLADFHLGADQSIEYAEARGTVVMDDRAMHRHGEGTKATWRPQTDLVTLDGSPATAVDGRGNRLTGATLTYRQGRSRVDVETSGSVPTEAVFTQEKKS